MDTCTGRGIVLTFVVDSFVPIPLILSCQFILSLVFSALGEVTESLFDCLKGACTIGGYNTQIHQCGSCANDRSV